MKMKFLTVIFASTLTLNLLAANTLTQTDVMTETGPSVAQLKIAQTILGEAIKAKENAQEDAYLAKLKKAQEYQRFVKKSVSLNAAFVAKYNGKKVNYFGKLGDASSSLRYDVSVTDTCFAGSTKDALALLKAVIAVGALDYDEEAFEKPAIKGKEITLVFNDKPNDLKETAVVSACK